MIHKAPTRTQNLTFLKASIKTRKCIDDGPCLHLPPSSPRLRPTVIGYVREPGGPNSKRCGLLSSGISPNARIYCLTSPSRISVPSAQYIFTVTLYQFDDVFICASLTELFSTCCGYMAPGRRSWIQVVLVNTRYALHMYVDCYRGERFYGFCDYKYF
ncbi:hypothetical protein BDZ94DRAFT_1260609 [Collybia nuda]|uniref:Uncharacterized protein n=1 Tax=Collybia nuda TaxID=64659 RepID=A0A9P5Y6S7_9AGAR|nr:hypothetical protein BDZ94DRAFT_1260609 [Collybia nuda]